MHLCTSWNNSSSRIFLLIYNVHSRVPCCFITFGWVLLKLYAMQILILCRLQECVKVSVTSNQRDPRQDHWMLWFTCRISKNSDFVNSDDLAKNQSATKSIENEAKMKLTDQRKSPCVCYCCALTFQTFVAKHFPTGTEERKCFDASTGRWSCAENRYANLHHGNREAGKARIKWHWI